MNRLFALMCLLSVTAAAADHKPPAPKQEDKSVLVFADPGQHFHTGSTVQPVDFGFHVLYTAQACKLVGHENMRRYYNGGFGRSGCWYPTTDDGFTYVLSDGHVFHEKTPVEVYARGTINPDGTVTITEPNFESSEFYSTVATRRAMRVLNRPREME